jgi:hypothetical protein
MRTSTRSSAAGAAAVPGTLVAAGTIGSIHAGFSFYWSLGGTWLLWSLGSDLLTSLQGREWILIPVGLVKLIGALAPIALARRGWPMPRVTRWVCWLGALVLIAWGGVNTVVGNLVLAGLISPQHGYDRLGMLGHAYVWDPLFLAWGLALAAGLLASRGRTTQ